MCGNFGLLALLQSAEAKIKANEVLRRQAAATELRGALAGGVAAFSSQDRGQVRWSQVRQLAAKRRSLSDDLSQGLKKQSGFRQMRWSERSHVTIRTVGHTRYPTSSRNTLKECHPHQWLPNRLEPRVYHFVRGKPVPSKSPTTVGLVITHNGDFEEYTLFGERVSNSLAGRWLGLVLHAHNSCAGDSPKIAGFLELLAVQGRWPAAVRLAYQRAIATSTADAAGGDHMCNDQSPNTAPAEDWIRSIAANFEKALTAFLQAGAPGRDSPDDQDAHDTATGVDPDLRADDIELGPLPSPSEKVFDAFLDAILEESESKDSWGAKLATSDEDRRAFIRHSVDGFFHADLFTAMNEFINNAHGSFGVQVVSAQEHHTTVIASRGQTMCVAFDPDSGMVMYASDSGAVHVPACAEEGTSVVRYLLSLDSTRGEVVELKSLGSTSAVEADSGTSSGNNSLASTELARFGVAPPMAPASRVKALGVGVASASPDDCNTVLVSGGAGAQAQTPAWSCRLSRSRARDHMEEEENSFRAGPDRRSGVVSAQDIIARLRPITVPGVPVGSKGASRHEDLVHADIQSIPSVVNDITRSWRGGLASLGSTNLQAGYTFIHKLKQAMDSQAKIHLVVLGIEVSQWVGEQFAADVVEFVPGAKAVAVSANQYLGAERVHFSSRDTKGDVAAETLAEQGTVVLVISQSGQTFPSLKCTARQCGLLGDNVFVLVGGTEDQAKNTEMGQVIINHHSSKEAHPHSRPRPNDVADVDPGPDDDPAQSENKTEKPDVRFDDDHGHGHGHGYGNGNGHGNDHGHGPPVGPPGMDHIFCNLSGNRPAEPSSVAVVATHTTLTELLMLTVHTLKSHSTSFHDDVLKLADASQDALTAITDQDSAVNRQLALDGQRWGRHVSESWRVMFLSGCYVVITVVLHIPIFRLLLDLGLLGAPAADGPWAVHCWTGWPGFFSSSTSPECGWLPQLVGILFSALDAIVYICLPLIFSRVLRILDGREIRHRHGKRTLVIADCRWVSQCLEQFVSKLYALSYGFASVEVHSAEATDDLVHRFAHRSARGVLLAVGRPDGRLWGMTKTEQATVLGTKQLVFVENLGSRPEVVSVGHNPFYEPAVVRDHVVLPSDNRPAFLDEFVYQKCWDNRDAVSSPRALLHSIMNAHNQATSSSPYAYKKRGGGVPIGTHQSLDLSLSRHHQDRYGSVSLSVIAAQPLNDDNGSKHNLGELSAFAENLDVKTELVFRKIQPIQRFLESRFASLERFVSFNVMFHSMSAETIKGLWFLPRNNHSRSQSHMRINTTACPVAVPGDLDPMKPTLARNRTFSSELDRSLSASVGMDLSSTLTGPGNLAINLALSTSYEDLAAGGSPTQRRMSRRPSAPTSMSSLERYVATSSVREVNESP